MTKLKKLGAMLPALGVAVLTGLSQVTISGSNVSLSSLDVFFIQNALSGGLYGALRMVLDLGVVIAMITFAWILYRRLKKRFRARCS